MSDGKRNRRNTGWKRQQNALLEEKMTSDVTQHLIRKDRGEESIMNYMENNMNKESYDKNDI